MFIFEIINNDWNIKKRFFCELSNKINVKLWRFVYANEILGISVQFFFSISIFFFKLSSVFWTFFSKAKWNLLFHSTWEGLLKILDRFNECIYLFNSIIINSIIFKGWILSQKFQLPLNFGVHFTQCFEEGHEWKICSILCNIYESVQVGSSFSLHSTFEFIGMFCFQWLFLEWVCMRFSNENSQSNMGDSNFSTC